ncbi:MAG: 4Fe-4S ferredoxin, partial [Eggerthellaceae bacterium]|nr:4Fe-4S ferredoxin [Eggerthellaceae bacterium]
SCPTDCITVDKESRTWSLVPFQCIQCGYCTQVCPKKCLAMDPNYWAASVAKGANTVAVPETEKVAAKPTKEIAEQTA